jgi:hypothetical protein
MFAVIYTFVLRPEQESEYQECWRKIVTYFKQHCGAIGSCLHKGENGLWVAYSRWPNRQTRDAAWPGDDAPNNALPSDIRNCIIAMQKIKDQNQDLPQFEDLSLEVVEDFLLPKRRHVDNVS